MGESSKELSKPDHQNFRDTEKTAVNPIITIGITCYAEGEWLLECWESVLKQTDDRWTAILIMDGTTHQRTREIFEQLEHPKLHKYALSSNLGTFPAHNRAFELSSTRYHFVLDGDDRLHPDSVRLVLDTFQRFPEAGYVYGDFQCFGANEAGVWGFLTHYEVDDLLQGKHPSGACAYKKETWEQLGGFANEMARGMADYDFFIGAAEQGIRGQHCGNVFYHYRVGHAGKVSQSYRNRYHEKCESIIRRHPAFFAEEERRRKFLAFGYSVSAEVCFHKGDYKNALDYAQRAAELGNTKILNFIKGNWRYRVPAWFIPLGNSAVRIASRAGILR